MLHQKPDTEISVRCVDIRELNEASHKTLYDKVQRAARRFGSDDRSRAHTSSAASAPGGEPCVARHLLESGTDGRVASARPSRKRDAHHLSEIVTRSEVGRVYLMCCD